MPRPATENGSVPAIGSTRRATFFCSSLQQPLAEVAAGEVRPSCPASGEVLTPKVIFSVGSSTTTRGRARGGSRIADRVADVDVLQPDHGDDVAGRRPLDLVPAEVVEDVDGDDPRGLTALVGLHQGHVLPGADRAGIDAADGDPAHVVGPIQRGDQHLQRGVGIDLRAGNLLQHQVQQRLHRVAGLARGRAWRSRACALVKM